MLSTEQYEAILTAASDQQFRDLLTVAWETGARPQEAVKIEKRHLDLSHGRAVFPEKESEGKKKKRVIHFSPAAVEIVTRLAAAHPAGPLFLNADGNAGTGTTSRAGSAVRRRSSASSPSSITCGTPG